jgi:hypothetical protein
MSSTRSGKVSAFHVTTLSVCSVIKRAGNMLWAASSGKFERLYAAAW